VYVRRGLSAVDESHDMRVVKAFKDFDFRVKIILQFLIELREIDRFDGYKSSGGLRDDIISLLENVVNGL
jgi:hypothetical protein